MLCFSKDFKLKISSAISSVFKSILLSSLWTKTVFHRQMFQIWTHQPRTHAVIIHKLISLVCGFVSPSLTYWFDLKSHSGISLLFSQCPSSHSNCSSLCVKISLTAFCVAPLLYYYLPSCASCFPKLRSSTLRIFLSPRLKDWQADCTSSCECTC